METWIVDRMEGSYAVCEGAGRKMRDIPLALLPQGIKEGDKICRKGEHFEKMDNQADRERIQEKMRRLLKKEEK